MRAIIAGSRDITDMSLLLKALNQVPIVITEVVCGLAKGVDTLGYEWAKKNNINIKEFPVTKKDWDKFGKKAGHLRNLEMAKYADCAIILWDGKSPGSRNMYKTMKKLEKPYFVFIVEY